MKPNRPEATRLAPAVLPSRSSRAMPRTRWSWALLAAAGVLLPASTHGATAQYGRGRSYAQESSGADVALLEQASQSMATENFTKALELVRPLAEQGHVGACYLVGSCYAYGLGLTGDVNKARSYFETAAAGDHPGALYELGSMHAQGIGVAPNEARGFEYFTRAAKIGDRSAISDYGHMLLNGIGVRADFLEGIAWVMVAADRGDEMARETIRFFEQDREVQAADRERAKRRSEELGRSVPALSLERDDLVDYNRFARAQGDTRTDSPQDVRPPAQATSLAGEWRGTASEEMDDGSNASFPIRIQFREARGGSVTADVVCDMQMPMEDGRLADIRATGSFTGNVRGSAGELTCADAKMTLVATNETASLGPQQLAFEVIGGTLSGRIGTDYDGWTDFRASRSGSPGTGRGVSDTGRGFGGQQGGSSMGTGSIGGRMGSSTIGSGTRADSSSMAPGSVRLSSHELQDPGSGNVRSHTLLVPEGWNLAGGARWNPQLYQDFVHLDLRVQSPDGATFSVYPGALYQWSNVYELSAQSGFGTGAPQPQPGQALPEGTTFMPLPDATTDYVLQILMPKARPRAREVRILEVAEETVILEARREQSRSLYASIQQGNQMGMGTSDMSQFADRVRVSYSEDGESFEEDLYIVGWVLTSQMDSGMGHPMVTVAWSVEDVRGFRTTARSASRRPILDAVSLSLRPDPRWLAMVIDLQAKTSKGALDGMIERGEIRRQGMESAWQSHQSTVQSRIESEERMAHKFVNAIRDVDDFALPDGSSVQLPSLYDHVYSDGTGTFVLSNEPLDATGNWTEIRPRR